MSNYITNVPDRIELLEKEFRIQHGAYPTELVMTQQELELLSSYLNAGDIDFGRYHGMEIVIGERLEVR